MVDPGREAATPTARMVAQTAVLNAMKWPMTRVLITEWWDNPDHVLHGIVHTLSSSVD